MAIALDVAATSSTATASPFTWSHTCTGSNLLLIVGIVVSSHTTAQPTVTAATYNGVSMVKATNNQRVTAADGLESSVWFLFNPPTGAHTVSVSFSTTGTFPIAGGVSVSYTGAQQSNTPDAVGGTTGTATGSQSFTVTTVANNAWTFAVGLDMNSASQSITANQTTRGNIANMIGGFNLYAMRAEDTNAPKTPAGAQTMGFTYSGTIIGWVESGASFAPFVAANLVSKNLFVSQAVNKASTY